MLTVATTCCSAQVEQHLLESSASREERTVVWTHLPSPPLNRVQFPVLGQQQNLLSRDVPSEFCKCHSCRLNRCSTITSSDGCLEQQPPAVSKIQQKHLQEFQSSKAAPPRQGWPRTTWREHLGTMRDHANCITASLILWKAMFDNVSALDAKGSTRSNSIGHFGVQKCHLPASPASQQGEHSHVGRNVPTSSEGLVWVRKLSSCAARSHREAAGQPDARKTT